MIVKKWFTILLALAFFIAPVTVFADDDDEYEYYDEEEETPKKSSKKKAATAVAAKKKSADAGPSRIGLYTSFGASSPTIGIAYDLGSGLQFGLGIGLYRSTVGEGDPQQEWSVRPIVLYSLGKGLLSYGVGLQAAISASTFVHEDGPMDMSFTPNFYVSAPLVPNVALSLNAGLKVDLLAEAGESSKPQAYRPNETNMGFVTNLMLVFYFL